MDQFHSDGNIQQQGGAETPGESCSVLVVEDNESTAHILRTRLRRKGFDVVSVGTGDAALELLLEQDVDLLILDNKLPDMEGHELVDRLRELDRVPPYLVITGHGNEAVAAEYLRRGALDYIVKESGFWHRLSTAVEREVANVYALRRLREAEAELSEKSRLNQVLLDALPGVAALVNRDQLVVACNKPARDRGVREGDSCWAPWSDFDLDLPQLALARTFKANTLQRSDLESSERAFEISWVPISGDLALQFVLDTTDKRRALEERIALETQFRRAQRMDALGKLAGTIAHDFKNLLLGITCHATVLRRNLPGNTPAQDNAEAILGAARAAKEVTQRILDFSRKSSEDLEPIDVHNLISKTINLLGSRARTMRVATKLEAESCMVLGSKGSLQTAILNLAINALDAMHSSDQLTLRTELVRWEGTTRSSETRVPHDAPYIRIEVIDTGRGMASDVRARAFEPLFTTKSGGRGTGLGLFAVYRCIKAHRGLVDIRSELGAGTTVSILLPLVQAPSKKVSPGVREVLDGQSGNITVVGDDSIARSLAVKILTDLGHHVTDCAWGDDAAGFLRDRMEITDIVLLDLRMPLMGGPGWYKKALGLDERVRTIFVTAHAEELASEESKEDELVPIIHRPFDPQELCTAVAIELAASRACSNR